MFGLQPTHLLLIFVIALIIFGPRQLPELGKALGKTIVEFKKSTREINEAVNETANQPAQTPPSNAPANPQPPTPADGSHPGA